MNAQSPKHHRLGPVQEDSPISIPANGRRKHLTLDVGALLDQLLGVHAVVDPRNPLLDDGALVQISRDKVRRRADDLDASLVGLVVGLRALERGQEAVVNVDDAAGHGLAESRRQDLHVSGENDELDAVLLDELEDPRLLLRLGVVCDGEVVELDAVRFGEGFAVGVVGDDDGDLGHTKLHIFFSFFISSSGT